MIARCKCGRALLTRFSDYALSAAVFLAGPARRKWGPRSGFRTSLLEAQSQSCLGSLPRRDARFCPSRGQAGSSLGPADAAELTIYEPDELAASWAKTGAPDTLAMMREAASRGFMPSLSMLRAECQSVSSFQAPPARPFVDAIADRVGRGQRPRLQGAGWARQKCGGGGALFASKPTQSWPRIAWNAARRGLAWRGPGAERLGDGQCGNFLR
jgi:hypothetical protein